MSRNLLRVLGIAILLLIAFSIKSFTTPKQPAPANTEANIQDKNPAPEPTPAPATGLHEPLDKASERVTKKPFGIYITKTNSPVQPERFSGYHTGTDFETFASEADSEVFFYAICDGKILQKRSASGYGGVVIQSCNLDNQAVTVIYGHVSLKSIGKNAGEKLNRGEKIGKLGQPPTETDGERKHLHLGIHKETSINIKGYVQSTQDLSGWLDFQKQQ